MWQAPEVGSARASALNFLASAVLQKMNVPYMTVIHNYSTECGLHYFNLTLRQLRRFQHVDSTRARDTQNDPNNPTFSDRIRSFLSQNPNIEEQNKATANAFGENQSAQVPQLFQESTHARSKTYDEEIKQALIKEFFARTEGRRPLMIRRQKLLRSPRKALGIRSSKSIRAKRLAETRLSRRKPAQKRLIKSKIGLDPADQLLITHNVNGRASTKRPTAEKKKDIKKELKKADRGTTKVTKSKSKKTEAKTTKFLATESEESVDKSRKTAGSEASQRSQEPEKEKSRPAPQHPEIVAGFENGTEAVKQKLVEKLTSQIAKIQQILNGKKSSKKRIRKLSRDHTALVRRKEALVGSDVNRLDERKDEDVKDVAKPAVKSKAKDKDKKKDKDVKDVAKLAVKSKVKVKKSEAGTSQVRQEEVKTAIHYSDASKLKIQPVPFSQPSVPSLAYGLERVLFNPGIYQLQDPRSRVYNFDPYLQNIMPITDFDFNALKEYITSSKDNTLNRIAQEQGKRYVGSTSSMTSMLAHFHYLLSQWRPINTSMLSKDFPAESRNFTELQRCPSAIFLRWKDGTYAIDADKQFDRANVLSMLGKSMEKLLTLSTDDFEKYRKSGASQVPEEEQLAPESYHYSTMGDFLMRSQLDAHDPRLPGTGMFDLKTRAVASIRMDVENYQYGVGYQIKDRQGAYESYEREYYDMIRAAFLKYSMQVRMGRMDGIFVAFHNIERIFGFQYISLDEMDSTIHGQWDTSIGDQEFVLSLDLLNKILDRATQRYPQTSIRLHFETRDAATPFMYIFAEPLTEEQVDTIQLQNNARIQEFEREILGLNRFKTEDENNALDDPEWDTIRTNVQNTMDQDELGIEEPQTEKSGEDLSEYKAVSRQAEKADSASKESAQGEVAAEGPHFVDRKDAIDGHSTGPLAIGNAEAEEEDEDQDECEEPDELETPKDAAGNEETGEEHSKNSIHDMTGCDDHIPPTSGKLLDESDGGEGGQEGSSTQDSPKFRKVERFFFTKLAVDGVKNPGNQHHLDRPPAVRYLQSGKTSDETVSSDANESTNRGEMNLETQADAPFLEEIDRSAAGKPSRDVLAMTLTVRNRVNGSFVLRPENLTAADKWAIEYSLVDVPNAERAWALYEACRARRRKKMEAPMPAEDEAKVNFYIRNLRRLSETGRQWREEMDERDKGKPVRVLGVDKGG